MLYTPVNDFGWTLDNFGATFTSAAMGTAVTSGGANLKGTAQSIWAGSSVTEDVYGIAIGFQAGDSAAALRLFLCDLLVDPAGGSSWSVKIANLAVHGPSTVLGGVWYYFPLYIKSGTSIGMQIQCRVTTITLRCLIKLFGKPGRPELAHVGNVVETIGASTATTVGTTVTPGTSAMGSYSASMGTTVRNCFWWQMGILFDDSTCTAVTYWFDLAAGDASNKLTCIHMLPYINNSSEQGGKAIAGINLPYRNIPAGANVYTRSACITTPDSLVSVVGYGVAA